MPFLPADDELTRRRMAEWAESSSAPRALKAEVLAAMEEAFQEADAEHAKARKDPDDAPPDFTDLFSDRLRDLQRGLGYRASELSLPEKLSLEKLQVSVAPAVNTLLKAWAASEGREVTSVLLQAVEVGLRTLKAQGAIPRAAIEHYEQNCQYRLALAEAKSVAVGTSVELFPF